MARAAPAALAPRFAFHAGRRARNREGSPNPHPTPANRLPPRLYLSPRRRLSLVSPQFFMLRAKLFFFVLNLDCLAGLHRPPFGGRREPELPRSIIDQRADANLHLRRGWPVGALAASSSGTTRKADRSAMPWLRHPNWGRVHLCSIGSQVVTSGDLRRACTAASSWRTGPLSVGCPSPWSPPVLFPVSAHANRSLAMTSGWRGLAIGTGGGYL
jgi:hypothetical protein